MNQICDIKTWYSSIFWSIWWLSVVFKTSEKPHFWKKMVAYDQLQRRWVVHTKRHAVRPQLRVFHVGFARCELQKWEVTKYSVKPGTYSLHIITVCILFAMMLGNRIRSPMLGFLSATWPNGLFAPAASQTNRCASNLGVVVIRDILSSMTWLLPGGGKIKPHQCMASISKSLWVGRSCFIQLLC